MNISLKNKRAVVCGSTQGIGKAIAEEFAESGAEVILLARNEDRLKEVIKNLSSKDGQKHRYYVVDFEDTEKVKKTSNEIVNDFLTIHILVNNTGGPAPGLAIDSNPELYSEAFSRHVINSQLLVQSFTDGMKNENYGRIINIISTSVKEPIAGLGVSNTIRAAMAGWSKTLAGELGQFGITVNNILPGYTKTGRLDALLQKRASDSGKRIEEIATDLKKDIPAQRFGEPEELAYLATFLASPLAGYINGANIPVDGGKIKTF